jgi:hypothetical protein
MCNTVTVRQLSAYSTYLVNSQQEEYHHGLAIDPHASDSSDEAEQDVPSYKFSDVSSQMDLEQILREELDDDDYERDDETTLISEYGKHKEPSRANNNNN